MTEHIWTDGPDGPNYHCPMCGISRVDDFCGHPTCESWIEYIYGALKGGWGFSRERWGLYFFEYEPINRSELAELRRLVAVLTTEPLHITRADIDAAKHILKKAEEE